MSTAIRSLIPNFYRPPLGLPLYWRDEVTGRLRQAVETYIEHCAYGSGPQASKYPEPTPEQLALLWDYVVHHIHAPCWERTCAGCFDEELKALRARANRGGGIAELREYVRDAMDIALDPF